MQPTPKKYLVKKVVVFANLLPSSKNVSNSLKILLNFSQRRSNTVVFLPSLNVKVWGTSFLVDLPFVGMLFIKTCSVHSSLTFDYKCMLWCPSICYGIWCEGLRSRRFWKASCGPCQIHEIYRRIYDPLRSTCSWLCRLCCTSRPITSRCSRNQSENVR